MTVAVLRKKGLTWLQIVGYALTLGMVLAMLASILLPLHAQRSDREPSYADRVLQEHDVSINKLKDTSDADDKRLVRLENSQETLQKMFWLICAAIAPTCLRDLRSLAALVKASKEIKEA